MKDSRNNPDYSSYEIANIACNAAAQIDQVVQGKSFDLAFLAIVNDWLKELLDREPVHVTFGTLQNLQSSLKELGVLYDDKTNFVPDFYNWVYSNTVKYVEDLITWLEEFG